jgi:hypothetical protein
MDPKLKFCTTIGCLDMMLLKSKEGGVICRNIGCLNLFHLKVGHGMRRLCGIVVTLGTSIPSAVLNSLPVPHRTSLLGMEKVMVYSVCALRTVSAWRQNGFRVNGGNPARNQMVADACGN